MHDLIARLQQRILRSPAVEMDARCVYSSAEGEILPPRRPRPPLPESHVDEFEHVLGVGLPSLVRRLYTEVGDGGFGPAWGINRLRQPPDQDFHRWWEQEMSVEGWLRLYRAAV